MNMLRYAEAVQELASSRNRMFEAMENKNNNFCRADFIIAHAKYKNARKMVKVYEIRDRRFK